MSNKYIFVEKKYRKNIVSIRKSRIFAAAKRKFCDIVQPP